MFKKDIALKILTFQIFLLICLYLAVLNTRLKISQKELEYIKVEIKSIESKVNQNVDSIEELYKGLKVKDIRKLTITGYSPRKRETDSTPLLTASMEKVTLGGIAVSRDLFAEGWVFGSKVYIEGQGIYRINDLMNERFTNSIDIFFWDTGKAIKFGKKQLTVALVKE